MNATIRLGLVLILTPLFLGCAGLGITRTDQSSSSEIYRVNSFSFSKLQEGNYTYLTPFLQINEKSQKPFYLGHLIQATEESHMPQNAFVHPNVAKSTINQARLTGKYEEMWKTYRETGVLDMNVARELGDEIGVKYLFVPIIVEKRESSHDRVMWTPILFSVWLSRTYITTVRLQLQIWNVREGYIAWEGYTDITEVKENLQSDPASLKHVVKEGWADTLYLITAGKNH